MQRYVRELFLATEKMFLEKADNRFIISISFVDLSRFWKDFRSRINRKQRLASHIMLKISIKELKGRHFLIQYHFKEKVYPGFG